MNSLKDFQSSFQKALLEGDLSILSQIPDTSTETHDVLLGVYQFAYKARLMEFLETDYPQLHGYLGDEQFADLAMAYIENNPSHHPNARWYGHKLPAFILTQAAYDKLPQIHELSLLEQSLDSIFDACEEAVLTLPQLAEISPDRWPALVFVPQTATKRLILRTNAAELWNALVTEQNPPDVKTAPDPLHYLVYRDDFQSSFRSMSYDEAMMWDKMAAGLPFGVLCELMAAYGGEEEAAMRAASYLQSWISSGLIVDDLDLGE